jgi:hypothetical protein
MALVATATDRRFADLVELGILSRHRLSQMETSGPGDAGHDDEDTENLDPAPHYPDGVIA